MHRSDDPNNFRNERYLQECKRNFLEMFRSYHRYTSYRNKLRNELTMTDEQRERLEDLDRRMAKNMRRTVDIMKRNGRL